MCRWQPVRSLRGRRVAVAAGLATLLATAPGPSVAAGGGQARPAGARRIVVVSDLHMGRGRDASGAWHPTEDFRWGDDLRAFLSAVDRDSDGAADLVFNGDTFDLNEAGERPCDGPPGVGCPEGELLTRLERAMAAHRAEIEAIGAFASAGSNSVTFVPGDADAGLLLPSVGRRLVRAVGGVKGAVTIATQGYWVSRDGLVHAEHGHQLPWTGHRLEGWPAPFVMDGRSRRLRRSPGEQLTAPLLWRLEPKYPLVDNMATLGAGLKRALGAEGPPAPGAGGPTATPELLRQLLLSTINWQQFRMELDDGDVEPPAWELAELRRQGGASLVSAIPDDDPLRQVVAGALRSVDLDGVVRGLSDDELVMLCDYRAAVRRARRRFEPLVTQFAPRGPAVAECPRTPGTRGGLYDYFWGSRDRGYLAYVEEARRRLPAGGRPSVFVLGHTHLADRSQDRANMLSGGLLTIPMQGFSPVRRSLTPVVINGGAWQRTITPVQLDRRGDRPFSALTPDDLAPCYGFVAIEPSADGPAPSVRSWRRDDAGAWSVGAECGV